MFPSRSTLTLTNQFKRSVDCKITYHVDFVEAKKWGAKYK